MKTAVLFSAVLSAALFAASAAAQQAGPDLVSGCAPCHSADGISRSGSVPNLAGQNQPYLLNQLRAFHTGKRAHKEMRYMSRNMTEQEMEAIASYFSTCRRGDPRPQPMRAPLAPPNLRPIVARRSPPRPRALRQELRS